MCSYTASYTLLAALYHEFPHDQSHSFYRCTIAIHPTNKNMGILRQAKNVTDKLTLQQLESFLWEATNVLRGNMDTSEFKEYIIRLLLLKRLSDVYDEEREKVINHYMDKGKTQAQATKLAQDEDEYTGTFFIPERGHWKHLVGIKHDIGSELNKAAKAIEEYNPPLEDMLTSTDFNNQRKLPDEKLANLISHFSKLRLRGKDFERPEVLGLATEHVLETFSESAGHRGGEYYTPSGISETFSCTSQASCWHAYIRSNCWHRRNARSSE